MIYINNLINYFFKKKNKIEIKELKIVLNKINFFGDKFKFYSNDELRNKTFSFKRRIKKKTKFLYEKQFGLQKKLIYQNIEHDILSKIEEIKNNIYKEEEKILLELLPETFAVIKETAKRFNKQIIVTSNKLDSILSKSRSYLELKGVKTKWSYIGWNMYDVQLMGGIVLHQGKIAEMYTGEGKTLVATLPIYLNALTGKGVHVVTVNEYLAKRDSEWMAPLMEFHGLTVDCIDLYKKNSYLRRKAYEADVTYGTNNEFVFDYLRDNMVDSCKNLIQRELNYAIIDEIDSVLIDEARTPLIISGVGQVNSNYYFLKDKVKKLFKKQVYFLNKIFNLSREQIISGNEKEGGLNLLKVYRGLPKYKPLIKFLGEKKNIKILEDTEYYYMQDNNIVDSDLFFIINEKNNTVEFSEKGINFLSEEMNDPNFFRLPDIHKKFIDLESLKISKTQKEIIKNELITNYYNKYEKIHTVNQLIKAYTLFYKNIHYLVIDNKVKIVDEQTGRIIEEKRYSDGLHQALEAKENVNIENSSQPLATITLQNYFRMYKKLSGMTGTAETESEEFIKIYNLDVVIIPTNKPIIRKNYDDLLFRTKKEKYNAIIDEIIFLSKNEKRPVLVGTTSVEISELISRSLNIRNIKNNVLNAKHHKKEASIIEEAGKSGIVTIATNMAGRGTDIKISDEVKKIGGLAIIGTERHDSRRIDRQLIGRTGRQGDPGSSKFYLSLEDDLMRIFGLDRILDKLGYKKGEYLTNSIQLAQKKIEENNFSIRKRLLEYDSVINEQRKFLYAFRRNASSISYMIYKNNKINKYYIIRKNKILSKLLYIKSYKKFCCKNNKIKYYYSQSLISLKEENNLIEKKIILYFIDDKWKTHIHNMEDLRKYSQYSVYEQKYPIIIYKIKAFKLFNNFYYNLNKLSLIFFFHCKIYVK
ncbi:Protein export cytoplasm protein SecA ATPase RNA helicase [Candidatus Karelsulcia muelleri]|uniref:Protein translocase subunit SecA n=1 Tax=Candidatus Karelsulcia muelleri TaxID=336810 RepID=A0A654M3F2_9FLAO|nr:DEAD/DEAH box helicase [Candidatus Karelsulcia muelleri]ALP70126.1 Protein export cytoplasm protein SecA ATPase RNA helicase [Candidatus Karelsulcia muelleri]QND78372.1 Preprotein translocase subunit SecA [Candidatus Karelsulcia muelleri]